MFCISTKTIDKKNLIIYNLILQTQKYTFKFICDRLFRHFRHSYLLFYLQKRNRLVYNYSRENQIPRCRPVGRALVLGL